MELEKHDKLEKPEKRQIGTTGPARTNQIETGVNKMADTSKDLAQGISDSTERVQAAGKKMTDKTVGVFDQWSDMYGSFFRFDGSRRLAEVYIETSEKIAHEALDYSRKFIELSAGGARKFWQVADEQLRENGQTR
jgi:hypothetical protein